MPVEIVLAVLVGILAIVTITAAYLGILGMTGTNPLKRCPRCGHLCITSRVEGGADGCGYCRHDRLLHPMWALRHDHSSYWSEHPHEHLTHH